MADVLRVAVLGAGTVGREVVRPFLESPERLGVDGGPRLELAGVAARDLARAAAAGIPHDLLTDAPAHLVASPDTDVVVELMGGDEPARTLIAAALGAGKPVVTANKHVVAHHGPSLEATAAASGAPLRFEAAVGGGVPVLGSLASDLAANCVERVRAIVNGTTNVILTAMTRDGRGYADALAGAQAAGYAEADPTADVEALDAANKAAILARVAFGAWLDPDAIVRRPPTLAGDGRPGITGVTDRETRAAAELGLVLKLVADLTRTADGAIRASVLPTAVPGADPLARTNGRMNRVEVRAEPVGSVAWVGPGAGGSATASAVLGDLLAIARGAGSSWAGRRATSDIALRPVPPATDGPERGWFLALPAGADVGPLEEVGRSAGVAVETRPSDDGIAVHVAGASLDAVRAATGRSLDAGTAGAAADPTIYPADEHR